MKKLFPLLLAVLTALCLGGDNEAILGTLGYTPEQVAKLREEGVI